MLNKNSLNFEVIALELKILKLTLLIRLTLIAPKGGVKMWRSLISAVEEKGKVNLMSSANSSAGPKNKPDHMPSQFGHYDNSNELHDGIKVQVQCKPCHLW